MPLMDSRIVAESARRALATCERKPANLPVVAGLDGFVDEICDVVDKRSDPNHYTRIETIASFAQRIAGAAGLSTNIEIVPRQVKLGGNGPIMANALVNYGFPLTYIGSVGLPDPHPVFHELARRCRVISIADPGHTDALEFNDGKLMMGKIEPIKQVNWENILARIPFDELVRIVGEARLVALVDWSILPYATEVWKHVVSDLLPHVKFAEPPYFFFDLADPEKRTVDELREALEVIRSFRPYGRVIAGFNRKEADQVAWALGVARRDEPKLPLPELTQRIGEKLDVWATVVHPTEEAAGLFEGTLYHVAGPYTPTPRLTTGAGDNFNAGLCTGVLLGLPPAEALLVGTATSGFYVRQMHSPSLDKLVTFLKVWANEGVEALDRYESFSGGTANL
ncbi:MAG: hypothetical protein IMX00_04600 [Limnochordales bacterium]|nr:hypothetical protein [Limnochordales bacterium]